MLEPLVATLITSAARTLTGARSLWLGCAPEAVQRVLRERLQQAWPEQAAAGSPTAGARTRAPSPLAQLNRDIAATAPAGRELRSAQRFRDTWSRICAEDEVTQAVEQGPENAGPLNSHMLVLRTLALMRSTLLQSTLALLPPMVALVAPATGVASNLALNFSSAKPPHRLAVVVCHAPCCWRAMKPLASRPMSSFQAGSSITASIRRAVFTSPFCISHHQ